MFRHMLKENPEVEKELGLNSDERTFIEELMKGEPYEKNSPPVSVLLHSEATSCFVISSQSVHTGIMYYISEVVTV